MKHVVAILDTMWNWRGQTSGAGLRKAPRFFRINPKNFTGQRLYNLIGPDSHLLVTDACPELVKSAKDHGTPDPVWLKDNIIFINRIYRIQILLVCGRVAQKTWKETRLEFPYARVIEIPHPAARVVWTKDYIKEVQQNIRGEHNENHTNITSKTL